MNLLILTLIYKSKVEIYIYNKF